MANNSAAIKILVADMEEEMQQFAIQTTVHSFESNRLERDIANTIKRSFDSQYQPVWNCIVGRDFGSHVVYQTKRYIFLSYHDNVNVLIWKSN